MGLGIMLGAAAKSYQDTKDKNQEMDWRQQQMDQWKTEKGRDNNFYRDLQAAQDANPQKQYAAQLADYNAKKAAIPDQVSTADTGALAQQPNYGIAPPAAPAAGMTQANQFGPDTGGAAAGLMSSAPIAVPTGVGMATRPNPAAADLQAPQAPTTHDMLDHQLRLASVMQNYAKVDPNSMMQLMNTQRLMEKEGFHDALQRGMAGDRLGMAAAFNANGQHTVDPANIVGQRDAPLNIGGMTYPNTAYQVRDPKTNQVSELNPGVMLMQMQSLRDNIDSFAKGTTATAATQNAETERQYHGNYGVVDRNKEEASQVRLMLGQYAAENAGLRAAGHVNPIGLTKDGKSMVYADMTTRPVPPGLDVSQLFPKAVGRPMSDKVHDQLATQYAQAVSMVKPGDAKSLQAIRKQYTDLGLDVGYQPTPATAQLDATLGGKVDPYGDAADNIQKYLEATAPPPPSPVNAPLGIITPNPAYASWANRRAIAAQHSEMEHK